MMILKELESRRNALVRGLRALRASGVDTAAVATCADALEREINKWESQIHATIYDMHDSMLSLYPSQYAAIEAWYSKNVDMYYNVLGYTVLEISAVDSYKAFASSLGGKSA